jgi:RNA polymerase sigma-70 factor (ECF subfamily)
MPLASVEDLVRAARAGDPDGIAGLYDRYAPSLYRVALRLSGSAADAEDVVHDVFVGLPEALRRYEEHGSLHAWLSRVTARTMLMRARSGRRRREEPLDDAAGASSPLRADARADASDAERAVCALPDGLRAVFVLRQIEGYAHDEIAALLGISVGASRVRLARALDALRRALG